MGGPSGETQAAAAIQAKQRSLQDGGFDLGTPAAGVEPAGSGGFVRRFANARIYWHPNTGAHEVHGNVLRRYLELGGPGANPATGRRDFGYPTADETKGHLATPLSTFEFGTVYAVAGTGTVGVWGRLNAMLQPEESGLPLTEPFRSGDLVVLFCRRGYLVDHPDLGVLTFSLRTPMLGRPAVVRPGSSTVLPGGMRLLRNIVPSADVHVDPAALNVTDLAERVARPWRDRLALRPVGSTELVPLVVVVTRADKEPLDSPGPGDGAKVTIELDIRLDADPNRPLPTRTLHDLVFRVGPETRTLAAHSVYTRRSWDTFGIIHATDLHVSARVDGFRGKLRATNSDDRERGARRMVNPNDSMRALINYANALHARGEVDLILATGDLVDYVYEDGQDRRGPGNFGLLERLILGSAPGRDPESPPNNELRVPIFLVLGNHDYVTNSYGIYFKIDIPLHSDTVVRKYDSFNMVVDDAIAVVGGHRPTVSIDAAVTMGKSSPDSAAYYLEQINDRHSYAIHLGNQHRVVMLDTGQNQDILDGSVDALQDFFGFSNEDEEQFKRGTPTTKGVSESALQLLQDEIDGAPDDGIFVVGIHTPPLNPYDNEYPYYFRESERPLLPPDDLRNRMLGFISRVVPLPLLGDGLPDTVHPTILRTRTPQFAQGALGDLLDFGIGRQRGNELLRLLSRPEVDVTLAGHIHEHAEFRLRGDRYFSDYYTETPKEASVTLDWFNRLDLPSNVRPAGDTRPIHIVVREGAEAGAAVREAREPRANSNVTVVYRRLEVPPYPDPLSRATDPAAWWRKHAPLVLLTTCLGPIDHPQRDRIVDKDKHIVARPHVRLQGIRLLRVEGPVITGIRRVGIDEIHAGPPAGPNLPGDHLDVDHEPEVKPT
jgi:hypothetical protein